jgi:hypothetical protein
VITLPQSGGNSGSLQLHSKYLLGVVRQSHFIKQWDYRRNDMNKLTKEQAVVITGFTGVMVCNSFSDLQLEVDKRLGYSTWTHQYGDKTFADEVKALFREDFLKLTPQE